MSFTSNSWKQSGGLGRSKKNQTIKAHQMAPSNLNITAQLGVQNSITPSISHLESSQSTYLYNFQNGKNFNNNIAYYPFNKEINTIGISNESLNPLLYNPSNFNLNYQGSGTSLSLVSSPFNQNATQFSQNAKTIISDFSYNTQNVFGIVPGNSISYAITVVSNIYVSSDASNFCFFGMDNLNQDALTSNGNITNGISNEAFYLWYPDYDGKATIYYTTISPSSGKTYGFSSQIDKVIKDQWHVLNLTLNGQYVYIIQNGETIFTQPFSIGTRVPDQPIAINLSSKYYDSSNNIVKSNGNTNNGNIQLLDYNITNFSADPSTLKQIKDFRDNIQNINNSSLPNRDLYLNYTIGEDINYLSSKIIAGNGIGNNGSLTNFGEFNNFSRANFYDTTTFYGYVAFDSSASIIYDSSINNSLEIYTLPGKAGQVTSSFLIENAGAVPGYIFNPTMLVYNGTSGQITSATTQNLVFSISGENVSIGDIFGTHTFDVSGNTMITGNLDLGSGFSDGKINILSQRTGVTRPPIAIGHSAGKTGQKLSCIAIGSQAGEISQLDNAIAIGEEAGYHDQGIYSIAIGAVAGYERQGAYSIAMGWNAGGTDQKTDSIAIGTKAGYERQDKNSIAIGVNAGLRDQRANSIAIGAFAGDISQNEYSIAIGSSAGYYSQANMAIAIGREAGKTDQGTYGIAMGYQAGNDSQNDSIAIGLKAGYSHQNDHSIAIGRQAGHIEQYISCIAIGDNAGYSHQNEWSIAIGTGAGAHDQGAFGIAMGYLAGDISQNEYSIAIGFQAGEIDQSANSIAIGTEAGGQNQGTFGIAMGYAAGQTDQSANSIAIGTNAGLTSLGENSIAIGLNTVNQYTTSVALGAGATTTANNQIVLGTASETVKIPGNLNSQITILDTQNEGYGSYPTPNNGNPTGTLILKNAYSDSAGNGSTGILFQGPTGHGNDGGAIGYIDNIGTTNQSPSTTNIPASYNYYQETGNENSCLYITSVNDVPGGNTDSLVLRSTGNFILDTGRYTVGSSSDYPNSTNRTAGGPISILPNGGSVGIGKLNPTTGYTLEISGNTMITGALDVSGNLSANNVGPSSDNQLEPNVASAYLNSVSPFSSSSLSQLNMNGYMFTRAILDHGETGNQPTGLIFGTGANTNQSDYISLVTNGLTRLYILPGGTVGINTTTPNNSYSLDVSGNINVSGSITSTGSYNTTSDLRLKENISDLDNSLEKICNIRGVSYNLKSDENKTKTSGVIAQEVIEHIPEAVNNMDSEKLSVNYNSIIAHLIESVKELKREIEELKSK